MLYHQHHNMLSPNLFSPKSLFIKEISSKELTWWKWSKHWPPGLQLVPYCFGKPSNNVFFLSNLIDFHNENQNNFKLCETSILVAPVARIAVTWNHHWNFVWEIILSGWYDMIWYVGDNYHWNFISEIILSGWYIWPLFNDLKSFRWHWKWIHG